MELHPLDIDEDGAISHGGFSDENPTLAWEKDYDQAVRVATRIARERPRRSVLILDSKDKHVLTVDEYEDNESWNYTVWASQSTLRDAEASGHGGISAVVAYLD